ncbi:MAG: 6-bladed beta-propeller [Gemmatimonadota bacterium]
MSAARTGVGVATAAVILAGCGGGSAPASSPVVSDSAGLRIVANPAPDRPLDRAPVRIADLMTPDSALTAVPWGVAADPATGRVYVLDRTGHRVAVFDRSGEYIERYGRRGEGPGEFQGAAALSVGPDGTLTVWDPGRAVLSRWSAAGDLLDERRAPIAYWGPGVHVGSDGLFTVTSSTSADEMRQMLVHVAADGDSTVLHTVARELVMAELPCLAQPMPRIFAPDIVWTARGDTVWVLDEPEYRIDIHVDGTPVESVRRPPAPLEVTDAMATEWARQRYGPFMRRCGGLAPDALIAELGREEQTAPVQRLAVDPAGRLWVTRSPDGLVPDRVDLLAPDGRYLGTFDSPGMPLAFLSPSRFVSLRVRPETGETILSIRELEVGVGGGPGAGGEPEDAAARDGP